MTPGWIRALERAAMATLVAFAAHAVLPDGGRLASFFDNRVYYALLVAASLLTAARAALVPRHRLAWLAVAAGLTLWLLGDVYYAWRLSALAEPPFPSIADALYLVYFPCMYAAVIVLTRKRLTGATRALWIDGATASLAAAALAAATLVGTISAATDGSPATVATNLAYPLGDMILLALLVGVGAASGWRQLDRATVVLGLAIAVGTVADAIYLFQAARGTYVEGTYLDALWPASMLLIARAAWRDLPGAAPSGDRRAQPLLGVPMICGVLATGLLVSDRWLDAGALAQALAALTIGCVLARLGLTFRENRRLLELTSDEATTDALTGLANRRKLMRDLDDHCSSLAEESPFLLALFDLDGFKQYNDTFGHPAGDALLQRLGERLSQVEAAGATAYRLGGDEFCIVAQVSPEGAGRVLDTAVASLTEQGEGFEVTTSFGAVFLPEEASSGADALRVADFRLYAHKHQRHARRDRAHEALAQALYARDPLLAGHVATVVRLSLAIGRALELSATELEDLERAAILHDIGKISIPDEILRKPGALTDDERTFVNQHTIVGQRIVSAAPGLEAVSEIVRSSHERWDGAGYPDGLAGARIPLAARIICATDAYAAMREPRPYAPARSIEDAIAELERCRGTQFDPDVAIILIRLLRERADEGSRAHVPAALATSVAGASARDEPRHQAGVQ